MNGRDFLSLAKQWAKSRSEAERRTAVSRAYYAAFHVAREIFEDFGFDVPRSDRAHKYLAFRLGNSGNNPLRQAGNQLDDLRSDRNRADYDLHVVQGGVHTDRAVQLGDQIIATLDALPVADRGTVTSTIRTYERDVLGEVTWRP